MGNLGQIDHEHLVGDGFAYGNGQIHGGFLETLGVEDTLHRHDVWFGIGHFNTDGALAGDRSYDTNTQSGKTQGDVVFQITYLGDTHALGRCDFIERDGWSHRGLDGLDLDTKVVEHLNDTVFVALLLIHIDIRLAVGFILLQQVERGIFVFQPRLQGVDGHIEVGIARNHLRVGLLLV